MIEQMTEIQNLTLQERAIACGKKVLEIEVQGLDALRASLDENFAEVIDLLLACRGQIIVTGMGKSGHIARKIASTLSSTGTRSIFIHPAEASHGDLGMIAGEDLVIALSNSGETRELSDLIAYCHRHTIPLVGMTLAKDSTLARQATKALLLPKMAEACPNRLAPTTSSTMMLALGDALAMTLLEQKGFSPKDFQNFHPGGKLGQQLSRVRDLMSRPEDTPLVQMEDSMAEVILVISQYRLGCAGVINAEGVLQGLITDGDLRRHLQGQSNILEKNAQQIMTLAPVTIRPEELAADAVRVMKERKVTNLFALSESKKPLGVIHIHDCLKAGIF